MKSDSFAISCAFMAGMFFCAAAQQMNSTSVGQSIRLETAYQRGFKARQEGDPRDSNPYKTTNSELVEWYRGWNTAEPYRGKFDDVVTTIVPPPPPPDRELN